MAGDDLALWVLPFTLPIGIWVAWSDMKFMRIPNLSVLALLGVYLLIGPFALPLDHWGWGWVVGIVVLVTGFILNMGGLIGAGDAKFAAAMAPFLAQTDPRFLLLLSCACLLGAFIAHRIFGLVPAIRRHFAWQGWEQPGFPFRSDFPMGFALIGILNFPFLFAVLP
ncbi:MAG: prepilin peptidase [Pseudorhodobacter sp.]